MNAALDVKIIKGNDGTPAFVQIPYDQYIKAMATTPASVSQAVKGGDSPVKAWREYLGLSQAEVATRMGISQPGYAQSENRAFQRLSTTTRQRIANALGIAPHQLMI